MNATQHIVLASSQEQHYATAAAAAAARTKTPPARPVKPGRRSTSASTSTSTSHHPQKQQQHALPFDRLSLQNTAPLMMPIEGCEKLFPQPRGRRNPCFVTEEEEEELGKVKLQEDLKRLTRVSLFESPLPSPSTPHPRKQQTTSRNELQDETESTESTTESAYEDSDNDNSTNNNDNNDDAALESLWQTAQQSTDEQQKLQVYWNLCYPQGTATTITASTTTTASTTCTPTKTRSLLSSQSHEPTKSCLNKRCRPAATATASATLPSNPDLASSRSSSSSSSSSSGGSSPSNEHSRCVVLDADLHTPPGETRMMTRSPARKKNHMIYATSTTTQSPSSSAATTTTPPFSSSNNNNCNSIQFAPSSAVEFHQDDPAHEWRVLEDAAVRFPTAERHGNEHDDDDDNDEDETKISESTWAALFAMEHAERRQNQSKCNDDDDDDDDDEGSLDGGLGRLVPGNLSRSSSTNIATLFVSSETSLLSDDSDRSLNFAAPAAAALPSSSSCHPPVFFAGFHEGFRMNSDQSLGVQSAASSGSTVSVDDAASTRRGMGLSSVKCAGRRHLLTRCRNDKEEEKIDSVGGAATAWD